MRARFAGTALDFVYRDGGQSSETATNYFNVVIDDRAPVVLKLEPGEKVYPIARELAPGEHSVTVWKRTESGQTMRIAILDDYQGVAMASADWGSIPGC